MNIKELALSIRDAMGDETAAFIMTNSDAIEFATRLFAARDAEPVAWARDSDNAPLYALPEGVTK